MPELPEVETVKRSLKTLLLNKTVTNIFIYYEKLIKNVNPKDFKDKLKYQTILDINRIGKFIVFELNEYNLLSHLRMEGKYSFEDNNTKTKHDHVIFEFNDKFLKYNDVRKFGCFYLFEKDVDLKSVDPIRKLGFEVFDKNCTLEYLKSKIQKSDLPIKSLLLKQDIISGLGNIYANEVLFYSRINPHKKGKFLNEKDLLNIIANSKIVLEKAINLGGTTIKTFSSLHIDGLFQNELLVHGQKECKNCFGKIDKIFISKRGTYFCPKCQGKEC